MNVPIDNIIVAPDRNPIVEQTVLGLMDSIQKTTLINPITIGDSKVSISADGMALAFGMIMLLGFCIHTSNKRRKEASASHARR